MCRYYITLHNIEYMVDVLPIEGEILNLQNDWFQGSYENSETRLLPSGMKVQVAPVEYFIATKICAFLDRGKDDYYSHDIEDIVFVLEHNTRLPVIIKGADKEVKMYIANWFSKVQKDAIFSNILPGHLDETSSIVTVKRTIGLIAAM